MAKPDSNVLKIADGIGLTAHDINSIQKVKRRRKLFTNSFYFVESLIGITSFLIGYTLVPIKVIESESGYPFRSVLLFSNLTMLSNSVKKRSFLRLIVVTLFICIFSFLLGGVTGYLFKFTSVPFDGSTVRYGVFTNDQLSNRRIVRRIADTKLDSLAKSVGLDQEDLTRVQISKKQESLNRLNPGYWFGQLMIFVISLFYSIMIGTGKQNATYPFESNHLTVFLAPVPLSAHIINAIYSITGSERSGLSKKVRLLVFFINFSLFASAFYLYYLSVPKVYHSGVMYGVFDATGS